MAKLQKLRKTLLFATCVLLVAGGAHAETGNSLAIWATSTPAPEDDGPLSLNQVTLGVGGITQSSPDFGRYNGMPSARAGFLGALNVQRRDGWDSGTTQFFSLTANNLNFGFGRVAPSI